MKVCRLTRFTFQVHNEGGDFLGLVGFNPAPDIDGWEMAFCEPKSLVLDRETLFECILQCEQAYAEQKRGRKCAE